MTVAEAAAAASAVGVMRSCATAAAVDCANMFLASGDSKYCMSALLVKAVTGNFSFAAAAAGAVEAAAAAAAAASVIIGILRKCCVTAAAAADGASDTFPASDGGTVKYCTNALGRC